MEAMIERHPFGSFVPPQAQYLILGSFTTKEAYDSAKKKKYVWFYANSGRNMFWPILEIVYKTELKTRQQMENVLTTRKIALADIILQCERKKHSNLDVHLINAIYAVADITKIVKHNPIEKILFTSKFVEKEFKRKFRILIEQYPHIELVTLPSPSPRYAAMKKDQKILRYKELLPQ